MDRYPMVIPPVEEILEKMRFPLAIDGCQRNCMHCPAFGSTARVERAPIDRLELVLSELVSAWKQVGIGLPKKVMHCWRVSDPLDYSSRTKHNGTATCADVALLWRQYFNQGLYVVTNGSEAKPTARRALQTFAATPSLVSQVKITITPCDQDWGSNCYFDDLVWDLKTLRSLWDANLPSTRVEDPNGSRMRLNVKITPAQEAEAREFVNRLLTAAGLPKEMVDDPKRIKFKPVYDLGSAIGDVSPVVGAIDIRDESGQRNKVCANVQDVRDRFQYGIRPNGNVFEVNMPAFSEADLTTPDGEKLLWKELIQQI